MSDKSTRRSVIKRIGAGAAVLGTAMSVAADNYPRNSAGTHINNWTETKQVVTTSDVSTPNFSGGEPKEPAAFEHNGTFYLAVAVWDNYSNTNDKEVVLLQSSDPTSGFTQVSNVTNNDGVYIHAPSVVVDGSGELWIHYSDRSSGANSIHAKHAPVDNIPSSPSDWTDEGELIPDARDSGIVSDGGGTYYLFYTDESTAEAVISRQESTDLVSWSNTATNVYDGSNNQGADVIPTADGSDYWMVTTGYNGNSFYATAGKGGSLTGSFSGAYEVALLGDVSGLRKSWYSEWTSHFDYCRTDNASNLATLPDGDLIAYFEGGDGSDFSVGFARADRVRETRPRRGTGLREYS